MKLESPEHPEVTKLAIFTAPRHGKSELVSRQFPAWVLGRNPEWEVICVQKNDRLSQDMGANVRDIVNSPPYKTVFPTVSLKQDAKAAGRWLIEHEVKKKQGVYYASGIGGTIIGRGANLLNIDDPLDSEGASSQRQRDIASDFYFGDAIQRLMHPRLELFTTTRRHEDDLAGRILPPVSKWKETGEEFVWQTVTKPVDSSDPIVWWVIKLPAIIDEGLPTERALWPGKDNKRFPLSFLKTQRSLIFEQGNSREWFCQYQQEMTPEEGVFCKLEWFADRYDKRDIPEDLWIYAASDYAVTEEVGRKDPDFTEHGIFGLEGLQQEYDHNGNVVVTADALWVLDWWYGKTTPDKWIESMVALIKKWQPNTWFGTKGQIHNAVNSYIEREIKRERAWCRFELLSDIKKKGAKAKPMQGMAAQRRILFPKTVWAERVIQNVCTFPNAKHDDAFDTLANIVRAMSEIPAAFSGAPHVSRTPLKSDSYEFFDTDRNFKSWKCA
jgi:predicted phage terminase large subunit-like protein